MKRTATTRSLFAAILSAASITSWAIDVKVDASDTKDFICKVAPNVGVSNLVWSQRSITERAQGGNGCTTSWWTTTEFTGGKFKANSCGEMEVVSSSADAASHALYAAYLKNAPQQPAYYGGTLPQKARYLTESEAITSCEVDQKSTRGVAVKVVAPSSARLVLSGADHVAEFFSLYSDKVDDETVVRMFDQNFKPPEDAFAKHEAITKAAAKERAAIKAVPAGSIKVETSMTLTPYSFETNKFETPKLDSDLQSVSYTYDSSYGSPVVQMPTYALTIPDSLRRGYKPANTDEARRIEQARTSGQVHAIVYLQPTKGWLNNGRPVINGVVTRIDVVDQKSAALFSLAAK